MVARGRTRHVCVRLNTQARSAAQQSPPGRAMGVLLNTREPAGYAG